MIEYYISKNSNFTAMTNKRSECDGCSAYKYCDVVISSIKLCNRTNSNK